jgi:hypothetical protein
MKGLLLSSILLYPISDYHFNQLNLYLQPPPPITKQQTSIVSSKNYKMILIILVSKKFPVLDMELENIDVRLNMKGKLFGTSRDYKDDRFLLIFIEIDF